MQSFEIESLPKMRFAHVYSVASYAHPLPPAKDCIEISLISEGEIFRIGEDGSEILMRKGDILFSLYDVPCAVRADAFHEHRTVCAAVRWRAVSEGTGGLCIPSVTPSHLVSKTAKQIIEQLIRNQLRFYASWIAATAGKRPTRCRARCCTRGAQRNTFTSIYTSRSRKERWQEFFRFRPSIFARCSRKPREQR